MSDVIVQVLEDAATINPGVVAPATPYDLMTLAEAKTYLGMSGGATQDAQISMWITMASMTIAEMCNRVFAKEKVREVWYCMASNSLHLTRWPVKKADLESVKENGAPLTVDVDFELEETAGHLYRTGGWITPIEIIYAGGYMLPQEAPADLKSACALLIGEQRLQSMLAITAGIRQISHKSARVSFMEPSKAAASAIGGGGSAAQSSARALLTNYTRYWV